MDHLMVFLLCCFKLTLCNIEGSSIPKCLIGMQLLASLSPKPFLFMFLTVGSMLIYNVMFSDYACI